MTTPLEVDHFIYATPDVDRTVAELGERLGLGFLVGGKHPAWGTRNAILPLGNRCYFEVIGPDEASADVPGGRIFGLDALTRPRLIWWAVRPVLMALTCNELKAAGFIPGQVTQGSRERPDGSRISWRLTDPRVVLCDGILPMVIDWEGGDHPGAASTGVTLGGFELHHPDGVALSARFGRLGLPEVRPAGEAAIVVHLESRHGRVTV